MYREVPEILRKGRPVVQVHILPWHNRANNPILVLYEKILQASGVRGGGQCCIVADEKGVLGRQGALEFVLQGAQAPPLQESCVHVVQSQNHAVDVRV